MDGSQGIGLAGKVDAQPVKGEDVPPVSMASLKAVPPPQPQKPGDLYQSRVKIYPKRVFGTFRNVKWLVMIVTLGIYYLAPWLRWDRGPLAPDQAILIDIPSRRFYFFFIEIWPQEVYYLTGLLILGALVLFLFTALLGRVWCGYACPQTVWTDLFIWVERLVQGDRNKRMKLDKSPWNADKIIKKSTTHAIWIAIAVATGGAWVFYFADAPTLLKDLFAGTAPLAAYISIAALAFTTYSLGGLMREQVCTYMCPWPRIQGAMFDADTLLVSYKADRGEPRAPHKKGDSWDDRGDCIDCTACVTVCPVGIDIRDGPQLECIQCALCIDACDDIMDKIGRPRGLIGYETLSMPESRARGEPEKVRLLRPRVILYAGLIVLISAFMGYQLMTRGDLDLTVMHDRNPLFVQLSDGSIRNGYTLKIQNKAHRERALTIEIDGLDDIQLSRPLAGDNAEDRLLVGPDGSLSARIFLAVPPATLSRLDNRSGESNLKIAIRDAETGDLIVKKTSFRAPQSRR